MSNNPGPQNTVERFFKTLLIYVSMLQQSQYLNDFLQIWYKHSILLLGPIRWSKYSSNIYLCFGVGKFPQKFGFFGPQSVILGQNPLNLLQYGRPIVNVNFETIYNFLTQLVLFIKKNFLQPKKLKTKPIHVIRKLIGKLVSWWIKSTYTC